MSNFKRPSPLIRVTASGYIDADRDTVYDFVQDLSQATRWNPRFVGGRAADPAGVAGSVLELTQERSVDVVEWAPMRRGAWSSTAVVLEADAGRSFRWSVQDGESADQASTWGFGIEPAVAGSLLTHTFEMRAATDEVRHTVRGMRTIERYRFFVEWRSQLRRELQDSVSRVQGYFRTAAAEPRVLLSA